MVIQEGPKVDSRQSLETSFPVMKVVVNYRKVQKQFEKNCSTSKEYLGQTTHQRASVTGNVRSCFSKQFSDHREALFTCATG